MMARLEDRHYRWAVVAYTLLLQAVTLGIVAYCFAVFAVSWLDEFEAPRRNVMLAITVLQISTGLVSPILGRAMDRWPMRHLVVGGVTLLGLGLWLCARAEALWQILLVYATVFPFAMALAGTLAAQTLVARWFTGQRGLAIGISAMGTNLGGVVFPIIAVVWLQAAGWRAAMEWLALAAVLLIVPLGWWVLRRRPLPAEPGGVPVSAIESREWTTHEICRSPMFWIPVVGMLPLSVAFSAVQFNLGAYVQDLGHGPSMVGNLIALCSVCMVFGKLFFGGLGDRLDHRYLYLVSAACMSAALLLLMGQPRLGVLVVGVALLGLAGGGLLPLLGVIYGSRFGAVSFGRVMGFVMLTMTVGAFGPFLAGLIHDYFGSYDWAFAFFLVLFLPGVIAVRRLP